MKDLNKVENQIEYLKTGYRELHINKDIDDHQENNGKITKIPISSKISMKSS